ncbi:hypothetical protein ACFW1A_10540 [Kitasatospora sp. NPDC058965]|uniref:hypothetical protein n=1 Tax=Kitasatospora sp. NPDC058965 TaxID=3346682 RepID=UPI00369AD3F8
MTPDEEDEEDDDFEDDLTARLHAAAGGYGPVEPPLAELRRLGSRRALPRRAARVTGAVVALAAVLGTAVTVNQFGLPRLAARPAAWDPAHCTSAPPARPAAPGSVAGSPLPVPGPYVDGSAEVAERIGESSYQDFYSGVCMDPPGHTLYLYRVRGSDFDEVVRAQAAPEWCCGSSTRSTRTSS